MAEKITCYAVSETQSRGRRFAEEPHPYRSAFERDRDRIMHSSAFRRLEAKTQVFMPGVNDHYRTRLTHSIEVAQIGRTIAKVLNLNESLTEAVCLGHDLGHSPFGHSGERVLDELMAPFGGFEHNGQAVRIVDLLEHPYPDFCGLNLMYETRLGFARHHGPFDKPANSGFEELNCPLEGQIADIADRIAYNCHDLEDGMRSELIEEEKLKAAKLFVKAQEKLNASAIKDSTIRRIRIAKTIIDILVSDCIETSKKIIAVSKVQSLKDVYAQPAKLVALSDNAQVELAELEEFLSDNLYQNDCLAKANSEVRKWLTTVFEKFCAKPESMPKYYRQLISTEGLQRTVCDYIAGMTDRFCLSMLDEI